MNPRILLLLSPLLFAACTALPMKPSTPENSVAKSAAKPTKAEAKLPNWDLSDKLLFEFLLAEVAGQRGSLGITNEAYAKMAMETRDPRIVNRALDIALFSGRLNEATEMAKLLLDIDPQSDKARQILAALLINQGKLEEARPLLEKLLGDEENVGQGLLQLNALLSKHPDKKASLELTQRLAKTYLSHAEAHYAIAHAAAQAGENELALAETEKAEELRPGWEMPAILRGQVLRQSSNKAALDFYAAFLKKYPKSQEVRLNFAKSLVAEKKFPEAKKEFEALKTDFPANPDMLLAVALLSIQVGDINSAIANFELLISSNTKDPDLIRYYLGQAYEQKKEPETAGKWYLSVGKGEHYLSAQIRYADILYKKEGVAKALAHLDKIEAKNDSQKILLIQAKAELLREEKLFEDVFNFLGQSLKKYPDSPEILYDHAMAAEKMDKIDVLEKDLKKLIGLRPDYAQAYNALGYTLVEHTDRLNEALPLIEKALSLAPDDPFILDSMGWIHYRMGNMDSSLKFLRRAFSAQPDPEIAAHLGEVLWVQGKRDEARLLWNSSLKEHPENEALIKSMKKFIP